MKIKNGEQCIVQYRGPPPFVLPVCNFYNMGPHAGKKVGPAPLCGTSKNIHVYIEIHTYVYTYIYIHMYTYTHVCVLSRIRFSADTERGIWLCVSVRCESQGRDSPKGCVIPREDFGRMCISRPHVKAWLSWSERGIANLNP